MIQEIKLLKNSVNESETQRTGRVEPFYLLQNNYTDRVIENRSVNANDAQKKSAKINRTVLPVAEQSLN